MNAAIEQFDAEIAALKAELACTEQMPPTIAERFGKIEAELRDAELLYRAHGFRVSAAHPAETAYLERQTEIGALMVVDGDKLLKAERERITAQGEGLSENDKRRRLDELRRQVAQVAARRELEVLKVKGAEWLPRAVHPEFAIATVKELERLAR